MVSKQIKDFYESEEVQAEAAAVSNYSAAAMKEMAAFDLLGQITKIYTAIRPFLNWADDFFLIPKKVRVVIKAFKVFLDQVTDYVGEAE